MKRSSKGEFQELNYLPLAGKDNFDGEIFIFSDIRDIALPNEPLKLDLPIFALCVNGSAHIRINLKEYDVKPNMLLTILPDHILQGYEISDDFEGLFLGVTLKYTKELSVDLHTLLPFVLDFKQTPLLTLTDAEVDMIKKIHRLVWEKIKDVEDKYYDKRIINNLLQALLFEVLNIYQKQNRYVPIQRSRNETILHDFIHLVEHDFKVNRSVAYYAERLCISAKYLSAVIKQISGRTASEWIENYVILAAKVMLESSSLSIKEISGELNFANQSFFGKFFKQHTGMSPNDYRMLNIKESSASKASE